MDKLFRKFGIITVVAVYFLILVGGIVRSTGSGMGCPDWPKCFGYYIPPTDVSQLPADYKTIFAVQGREIADFNVFHTWTEYINRLIGALIGLFIFITFILSFKYFKKDVLITILSFLALVGVLFQAWLGMKVVETDLQTGMITTHMLAAIVIVCLLIYTVGRSYKGFLYDINSPSKKNANLVLLFALLLSLVQITLGTQVREHIDLVAKTVGEENRISWVEQLGGSFLVHRSLSWLLLAVNAFFVWFCFKNKAVFQPILKWVYTIFLLISAAFVSGLVLYKLGMPAWAQPVHMLLGTLIFGVQFIVLLVINNKLLFGKKELKIEEQLLPQK